MFYLHGGILFYKIKCAFFPSMQYFCPCCVGRYTAFLLSLPMYCLLCWLYELLIVLMVTVPHGLMIILLNNQKFKVIEQLKLTLWRHLGKCPVVMKKIQNLDAKSWNLELFVVSVAIALHSLYPLIFLILWDFLPPQKVK